MKDRTEEEIEINRYVSSEMTQTEVFLFEEKMEHDLALKNRVEEHKVFLKQLNLFGNRIRLKQKLEDIHLPINEEVRVEIKSKYSFFKSNYRALAIAASVALIALTGTIFVIASLDLQKENQAVQYQSLRRDIEKIKKSQYQILEEIKEDQPTPIPGKYTGTGFVIGLDGYIATSYHIINGARKVFVKNEKFGQLEVDTFFVNVQADIAILKVSDKQFPTLPYGFNTDKAGLGERIFTLGFPREEIVYGEGYISSATGYNSDTVAYQVSIPVNPGNSGGPIIDESGNVAGLISGRQTETEGASFATRINMLQLLDIKGIDLKKKDRLSGKGRKQQVQAVKDFVFEVKVVD